MVIFSLHDTKILLSTCIISFAFMNNEHESQDTESRHQTLRANLNLNILCPATAVSFLVWFCVTSYQNDTFCGFEKNTIHIIILLFVDAATLHWKSVFRHIQKTLFILYLTFFCLFFVKYAGMWIFCDSSFRKVTRYEWSAFFCAVTNGKRQQQAFNVSKCQRNFPENTVQVFEVLWHLIDRLYKPMIKSL